MPHAIGMALFMAAAMGWKMLWALILGFLASGAVEAVVGKGEMARLMPDARARSILRATALGVASSSCSYAAVAIARTIVRKGGDFTAAMAFQVASTNLVLELGLVLWALMGARFAAAVWLGGIVMIPLVILLMRLLVGERAQAAARRQADKGLAGRMEGHAAMDMAVTDGPLLQRLLSPEGFTASSHYFVMNWASLWLDLIVGLVVAGAIAAWVPPEVWSRMFFADDPVLSRWISPLVGPLVAVATFVCSVGNVPLADVLWRGGAGFGGVVAFVFGDLIVLPILDIFRRYYGLRMTGLLFVVLYLAMAGAGFVVEFAFGALRLTPARPPRGDAHAALGHALTWDYTTALNLASLLLAAVFVWRFATTGGPAMLARMNRPTGDGAHARAG